MGLDVSRPQRDYTELYLPADTFRVCPPDNCWCQGRHRSNRYMYVERGGDGKENFHDPMEYMDRIMSGGSGWPGSWKDARDWTTRDFERLGDVMGEYENRVWGRRMGGVPTHGGGGGGMTPAMMTMMMMAAGDEYGGSGGGGGRYRRRSGQFSVEMWKHLQRMVRENHEQLRELSDAVYGSDAERRQELARRRMFKLWQDFQQQGMSGGGGMGGNGMPGAGGMGMGMGMPGMMPNQFGGMGGPAGMGGPPGMGMNGMMPGAGGMGQMNGYGDDMLAGGGLGGGGLSGRRGGAYGRGGRKGGARGIGWGDDLEDEFGLGLGDGRGDGRGFNGGRRRDDDWLDGYGDGRRSSPPRGPVGPRRPPPAPRRPGGGAGAVFDDGPEVVNPYRGAASRRTAPDEISLPPPVQPMPNPRPHRVLTPMGSPILASPPPGLHHRPTMTRPQDFGPEPIVPPPGAFPVHGFQPAPFDMGDIGGALPHYPHTGLGREGGWSVRPPPPTFGRSVSFHPAEVLARPREDEERRGEPHAGAEKGRRDVSPRPPR